MNSYEKESAEARILALAMTYIKKLCHGRRRSLEYEGRVAEAAY